MPLLIKDENNISTIVDLSESEKIRWRKEFGLIRSKEQLTPAAYIDLAVNKLGGHEVLRKEVEETTQLIYKIRSLAWDIYIQHEQMVCGKALAGLLKENASTKTILKELLQNGALKALTAAKNEDDLLENLSQVVGDISGRIFPYQYELAKSVTQSRRSRAGTAFECVIRHVIDIKGFPCDDQSKAGTELFEKHGLGKIVDGLLPGLEQYNRNRAQCAVLTMKTTLRERWQEVVEELERTKVPHIYLLTLDEAIGPNLLATMKSHNITLVAPLAVAKAHSGIMNLISFEQLFNKDLPHLLEWWKDK